LKSSCSSDDSNQGCNENCFLNIGFLGVWIHLVATTTWIRWTSVCTNRRSTKDHV
jgi:hypothetical protein